MMFLMGLDGPVRGQDPNIRALMKLARTGADEVFSSLRAVPARARKEAVLKVFSAFRKGGGTRVDRTAKKLRAKGMSARKALREALARELAATTMSYLQKFGESRGLSGTHQDSLGFVGYLRDAAGRVGSAVASGASAIARPIKTVARKTANAISRIGCTRLARFAAPAVAAAAGTPAAAAAVAAGQGAACRAASSVRRHLGKKKSKTVSRKRSKRVTRPKSRFHVMVPEYRDGQPTGRRVRVLRKGRWGRLGRKDVIAPPACPEIPSVVNHPAAVAARNGRRIGRDGWCEAPQAWRQQVISRAMQAANSTPAAKKHATDLTKSLLLPAVLGAGAWWFIARAAQQKAAA